MLLKNTDRRWGAIAQLFHWLMFLLILGAWFAVESHEDFPKGSEERAQWMMIHKALGTTVFFLVWFRLSARIGQATPAAIGAASQQFIARFVHVGLYAVMIAMPMTGLLASQYFGRPVSWFGLFEIPVFLGEHKDLGKQLMEIHEGLWSALVALVLLHAGGALYHHIVQRDDVLKRMLPWGK
ncbi:MAG: cytochrome b [Pseudomonadota bacterium]